MAKLETPEVLEMVRDMGPLPQTEALEYAKNLSNDQQDGKNGCLVDFEINKMTDAMEDIISLGENEIKKISLNNKNLVSKSFSWEKLAKKLLKS